MKGQTWAGSGQEVSRKWAGSGQKVSRNWTESGQELGRKWAESGQEVGRKWTGTGQRCCRWFRFTVILIVVYVQPLNFASTPTHLLHLAACIWGDFFSLLQLNFSMLQPLKTSLFIRVLWLLKCYSSEEHCHPSVVTVSQWENCQPVFTRCFT